MTSLLRAFPFPVLLAVALLAGSLTGCDATIQIGDPGTEGPLGDAIDAQGEWAWVPVRGTTCRDGSRTGFGARLQENSRNLLIYLEGGGACFNPATCARNTKNFTRAAFRLVSEGRATEGILDPNASDNPVADWNAAYVPYCTGDVHAGSAADVRVEGVDDDGDGADDLQQFAGRTNLERDLDVLTEHFADSIDHVLLAGASAGGFGTLVNYEAVRAAFPEARVTLLDDSGPPVADREVLTPALEARWRDLWDIDAALSPEARAAVENDGLVGIYSSLSQRFPGQTFGLLSHRWDATIRDFYGFQQPNCDDPGECVRAGPFANALRDVRDRVAPRWSTYFIGGVDHTFLLNDRFYRASNEAGSPAAWTRTLLEGGDVPDVTIPD